MPANILAVLLIFGCGLIHLVAGQCIEVQKSEEEVEEPKSDVWLPNRFHGKTNGFFVGFFLNQIIRYKRFCIERGKNFSHFFRQCLKIFVVNTKRICIYHN